MSISGRFVAITAVLWIAVLAIPVDPPWGLVIVNLLLFGAGGFDLWRARGPSKITITRTLPPMVTLGNKFTVEWEIASTFTRRVHVRLSDEFKPSLNAQTRRISVFVPREGRVFASTELQPNRRGRFVIEKMVVRTYGPWGLWALQKKRDVESVLRVYPSFASRKEAELRIEKARVLEVGLRSVRSRGGGTEFDQLREYSVDDDFRRIDWAATARAGKPIVRTYRAEQNQNVLIMLDCGRVMAGRVADVPRLEHAMDATMALATVAARLGDRVGLIAFDYRIRSEVAAHHGNSQIARMSEAMYELEPELLESDYRSAFVHALSRFRRRSLVVVLTELAEQAVTETLMPALPLISKNHLVVVSSVRDGDLSRWAHAVPTEANKAYRKAAAMSALDGRRRIIAGLKSRGATVVDSEPGKLAAELADTYLQVKATGRL